MNIQKINNFNNITFQKKDKNNKKPNKKGAIISCKISEQEEQGRKQITITFDKKQFLDFINSILSIFNLNKSKNNAPEVSHHDIEETQKEATPIIQEPIFPTPKFTSNPTLAQRNEYINELLKYINSTPDTKLQLKALSEIEKYGISDIDYISTMMLSEDESIIRETLKIYQKYGTDKDAYIVIEPIAVDNTEIKEDKTFIEVLKTIQKLAHLENDDPKDREIILKPVRRLLNHKSEKVRRAAQETLDKLS